MADRIIDMRERLYDLLQNKFETPGDWSHVKKQIGEFSCAASRVPPTAPPKIASQKGRVGMVSGANQTLMILCGCV